MKKIIVYTDGSCLGNPGPGGWAYLIIERTAKEEDRVIREASGMALATTNNRMEMQAIAESLKYLKKTYPQETIEIHSDSNLLVQTINLGWKKKANLDLWVEIDQLLPTLNFQIFWVKAHHQDQHNNRCDELALAAAEKAKKEIIRKPWLADKNTPQSTQTKNKQTSADQTALF